jgi:hypothetical protein
MAPSFNGGHLLPLVKKAAREARNRRAGRTLMAGLAAGDQDLIERIRDRRLSYLSSAKLAGIATLCRQLDDAEVPGVFIEAGCALGGSTILIASVKDRDRPLSVYDVFGMIPPPSNTDTDDVHDRYRTIAAGRSKGIGGDRYYGYEPDLYEVVCANLSSFDLDRERESISLVKGLLQETLLVDQPVAFAHIDVDWYDPVMTCLTRIFPRLAPGGTIVLDDYHDWGGCRKATDEFLTTVHDRVILDDTTGAMTITRG